MFFDKILVENSELRRVWRAGFGRMEEPEENISFPNICADLNECIGSDDPDPRRRLSLRTSSVLVEGAARIYRQELSRLMEDLSEFDRVMAIQNERKLTDAEGDTSTDSSNPSSPDDTPELMRRQIPRHSDVSIQRPDNEHIKSLEAPDLSHHLSSISKSTTSPQKSRKDIQNGLSAKRQKITDQTNRSSEYPSSPDLTTDRNSEDSISDEELDLADDNQNTLLISEQPTNDANTKLHSDNQATRRTDQNELQKSSEEENTHKSPDLTFTEKFDFVASFPTFDPDSYTFLDKSVADKNCEIIINEADTRNKSDDYVTIRKKVITVDKNSSAVKRWDRSDVVEDSDNGRVDLSPILPSSARMVLQNSRRDVSIQRPDNEHIKSLEAPDLSHPLSSISKSTNSPQKSRKDVQNGLSAKRQKITDQTNRSSEYPSSPDDNTIIRKKVITVDKNSSAVKRSDRSDVVNDSDSGRVDFSPILPSTARNVLRKSRRGAKNINKSVVKKDQATQMDDVSFHPNTSERDRSANVNLPFGYLLIHDTYSSRYPSKIVMSSLNPFVRNL